MDKLLVIESKSFLFPKTKDVKLFENEQNIKLLQAYFENNDKVVFKCNSADNKAIYFLASLDNMYSSCSLELNLVVDINDEIITKSIEEVENELYVTDYYVNEIKPNDLNECTVLLTQYFKCFDELRDIVGDFKALVTLKENIENFYTVCSQLNFIPGDDYFATNILEERIVYAFKDLKSKLDMRLYIENLQDKVKESVDRNQKEFYLREQMKVLTSELGDEDDTSKLEKRLKDIDVSDEIREKISDDISKLSRLSTASPDYMLLLNYIELALSLPWNVYTKDSKSFKNAEKILNDEHYGIDDVKKRLLETIAVHMLSKSTRCPILCLYGPPGIGKTSIARSLAHALNRKFVRMSLGGLSDEAEIRGHRKTYIGAMPGRILTNIKLSGSANPVFLMDEIDKLSRSNKGDPSAALLEVLDPEQNITFRDNFLELPFDLSKVFFITTANSLDEISDPLLDRMELIEMSGYTFHEKMEIAKRYIIPKVLKALDLKSSSAISLTDDAIAKIINNYTAESGVRNLEKQINAVIRKSILNRLKTDGKKFSIIIQKSDVTDMLGIEINPDEIISQKDEVGVVHALAWTTIGGSIFDVEVTLVADGKGDSIITGNLGDVMTESVKLAITNAKRLIAENHPDILPSLKEKDIHIHCLEGGTPKDGPSAGITITTAIYSAVCGIPVKHNVAMTGEISLRGKVCPIGGLKEKSLAAIRNKIKTIVISHENKKDFDKLSNEIKEKIEYKFVDSIEEVLKLVLVGDNL